MCSTTASPPSAESGAAAKASRAASLIERAREAPAENENAGRLTLDAEPLARRPAVCFHDVLRYRPSRHEVALSAAASIGNARHTRLANGASMRFARPSRLSASLRTSGVRCNTAAKPTGPRHSLRRARHPGRMAPSRRIALGTPATARPSASRARSGRRRSSRRPSGRRSRIRRPARALTRRARACR